MGAGMLLAQHPACGEYPPEGLPEAQQTINWFCVLKWFDFFFLFCCNDFAAVFVLTGHLLGSSLIGLLRDSLL